MKNLSNLKFYLKKQFPGIIYKYLRRKNQYQTDRVKILNTINTDVLVDVGANIGLYSHSIRHNGFKGKIISFEPQNSAFKMLSDLSKSDNNWYIQNFGLGAEEKTLDINLSQNSVSSSILPLESALNELCPEAGYIGKQSINIKRLDTVIDEYCSKNDNIFVKIDTQGYETEVIEGAKNCIDRIVGFQIELSFIELYKGEKNILDMIIYLNNLGYKLVYIEPGWNNQETGFGVQVDGIFVKI